MYTVPMSKTPTRVEPFVIAPGFFILNENTISGYGNMSAEQAIRNRSDLKPQYDQGYALKKNAQYLIATHCVSTPFGYFSTREQLQALESKLDEIRESVEMFNIAGEGVFQIHIGIITVPAPTDNEYLNARLRQFVIAEIDGLKEKLLSQGDRKAANRPFLFHTDTVQRLAYFCTGVYADSLNRLLEYARETAKWIRSGQLKVEDVDVSKFDAVKALFEYSDIATGGRQ